MERVVIIGTGTMAVGIGAGFLASGFDAIFLGRTLEKASRSLALARQTALSLGAQPSEVDPLGQAGLIEEWSSWQEVVWVLETVAEDFELKRVLFAKLDKQVPAAIPIGSNSSGFPISRIAAGLSTRQRMFNAHYFMPAHLVPLVEIALGVDSSAELARAGVCHVPPRRQAAGAGAPRHPGLSGQPHPACADA